MTRLSDAFAELRAYQAARTRVEQHGSGRLTLSSELPQKATGCILSDGTLTDAECLLHGSVGGSDVDRVWTRRLAGTSLRRRGRLTIESGVALRFADDPGADAVGAVGPLKTEAPSLQRDLDASDRIRALVQSDLFGVLLYGALCNTTWRHVATGTDWSCSWRASGDVVATLRGEGDYLDWYCSDGEGLVDEQVLAEIRVLGWELVRAEPPWE